MVCRSTRKKNNSLASNLVVGFAVTYIIAGPQVDIGALLLPIYYQYFDYIGSKLSKLSWLS